jgi:hypothetical protein
MPNLYLKICLVVAFAGSCLRFTIANVRAQEAFKVDDITNPRCDLSEVPTLSPAPWGRFTATLSDNGELRGAIVVYGMPGLSARYAKNVKEWLVSSSGIRAERLVTVYGGQDKELAAIGRGPADNLRMEMWAIPKGATTPPSGDVDAKGQALHFDTYTYTDGELCDGGRRPALRELAEALRQRSTWKAYFILRLHQNKRGTSPGDRDWDPDGNVSRHRASNRVAADKQYLIRNFGVAPSRLMAMVGDNDEWTHVELWLVPPGAGPPMATRSTK